MVHIKHKKKGAKKKYDMFYQSIKNCCYLLIYYLRDELLNTHFIDIMIYNEVLQNQNNTLYLITLSTTLITWF